MGEAEAQRAKWVEEIQGRLKQFEDVRGGIQKYQELAEALAEEARVLRKGRAAAAKVAEEKARGGLGFEFQIVIIVTNEDTRVCE